MPIGAMVPVKEDQVEEEVEIGVLVPPVLEDEVEIGEGVN